MEPDSLKSESCGIGGVRVSTVRESWLSAISGTFSSRATSLSPRDYVYYPA